MDDKQCVKLLLNKSVEIHGRINNAVEEILRRGNGKETTQDLIESLRYVADEMERLIQR